MRPAGDHERVRVVNGRLVDYVVRLDDEAHPTALKHGGHDGGVDGRRKGLNKTESGRFEEAEVVDLTRCKS